MLIGLIKRFWKKRLKGSTLWKFMQCSFNFCLLSNCWLHRRQFIFYIDHGNENKNWFSVAVHKKPKMINDDEIVIVLCTPEQIKLEPC